jgi:hypothetical protein
MNPRATNLRRCSESATCRGALLNLVALDHAVPVIKTRCIHWHDDMLQSLTRKAESLRHRRDRRDVSLPVSLLTCHSNFKLFHRDVCRSAWVPESYGALQYLSDDDYYGSSSGNWNLNVRYPQVHAF